MRESKKRTAWMVGAGIIAAIGLAGCQNDIEPEKPPAAAVPGAATGSGQSRADGTSADPRGGGVDPNAGRRK